MSVSEIVYLSFSAKINQATTEGLLDACAELANRKTSTIYLMLSTLGGSVINGITLYNTLRALPLKLITHNMAAVNSVGNVVFLAGDERYACPNATFMFHGVGFDVKEQTRFEERRLKEKLESVLSDQRKIGAVIAERTSLQPKEIGALFRQAVTRDPEYARTKGIIHGIRDVEIPPGSTIRQLSFER
jgi:ATP-dependent protease ClpP protease subunit